MAGHLDHKVVFKNTWKYTVPQPFPHCDRTLLADSPGGDRTVSLSCPGGCRCSEQPSTATLQLRTVVNWRLICDGNCFRRDNEVKGFRQPAIDTTGTERRGRTRAASRCDGTAKNHLRPPGDRLDASYRDSAKRPVPPARSGDASAKCNAFQNCHISTTCRVVLI